MSNPRIKCTCCENEATKFISELSRVEFTPTKTGGYSTDTFCNMPYCDEHFQKLKMDRPWLQPVDISFNKQDS